VNGTLVPLTELVDIRLGEREKNIYHKDLLPVVYVTADVAGGVDSPFMACSISPVNSMMRASSSSGTPSSRIIPTSTA